MTGPHATGVWISADFASVVRWSSDLAVHPAAQARDFGKLSGDALVPRCFERFLRLPMMNSCMT